MCSVKEVTLQMTSSDPKSHLFVNFGLFFPSLDTPFPQIDIIRAMMIVWRIRGKIIRSVLCNIVCNDGAQCNAHIHCESKKQGTTILSITVDRISNFFTDRFISKYATKSSLTIPSRLKGVAELPFETSVSENSENLMHALLSTTNHKVV